MLQKFAREARAVRRLHTVQQPVAMRELIRRQPQSSDMGRHQNRRNAIPGLKKRCQHLDWNRCECPWYGSYRTVDKKNLNRWARRQIPNRQIALRVFADFQKAIDEGTYTPDGQAPRNAASQLTFSDLLDLYRFEEVGAQKHGDRWELTRFRHQSSGTLPMLDVLEREFGEQSLHTLATMDSLIWKQRLDRVQKERNFSDRTWNRYFQLGSAIFSWAKSVRRLEVKTNPFEGDSVFYLKREAEKSRREVRVSPAAERRMIDICLSGQLDNRANPLKLTPFLVACTA